MGGLLGERPPRALEPLMNALADAIRTVAVIYTGGTIGMHGDPLKNMKDLEFVNLLSQTRGFSRDGDSLFLIIPSPETNATKLRRIRVELTAPIDPLDSSMMQPENWADIAIAVERAEKTGRFHGIVVLHGTDTMAWTASALSFLLGTLTIPVVMTGSQSPLSHTRTDAVRNLISAIEIAAEGSCPKEVCIFFDQVLLRGNRATKIRASGFDGFESPNLPALGTAGTVLRFVSNGDSIPSLSRVDLDQWKGMVKDVRVIVVRTYPGMNVLPGLSSKWTKLAIVVEGYGAGTAGSGGGLKRFLTRAKHRNSAHIILRTQVPNGAVEEGVYEAADWLKSLVIAGSDITSEACTAKLFYLLAKGMGRANVEEAMRTSLRGEVTIAATPDADQKTATLSTFPAHYRSLTEGFRLAKRLEAVLWEAGVENLQHEVVCGDVSIDMIATKFDRRFGFELGTSAYGIEKAKRDVMRLKAAPVDVRIVVGALFSQQARDFIESRGGKAITWEEAFKMDWRDILFLPTHVGN
jgi:L-asparaginase